MDEILIDIVNFELNDLLMSLINRHDSSITQLPIGTINRLSSAAGIKLQGG